MATATASLRELTDPLSNAARLHAELRELGWKSAAALRALDQVAAGVIIRDGDGSWFGLSPWPPMEKPRPRSDACSSEGVVVGRPIF
jgi:hypothetical protein